MGLQSHQFFFGPGKRRSVNLRKRGGVRGGEAGPLTRVKRRAEGGERNKGGRRVWKETARRAQGKGVLSGGGRGAVTVTAGGGIERTFLVKAPPGCAMEYGPEGKRGFGGARRGRRKKAPGV